MFLCLAGLTLGLALPSCGRQAAPPDITSSPSPALSPGARTFVVQGVVRELRPDTRTAIVEHEEIPGYMAAMTMPIQVRDLADLEGLAPDDLILFRLVVTDDDAWMDQVTRLGRTPPQPPPDTGPRVVRYVEPLEPGDALPDYPLTNQFGRPFRLDDYRGRALALTFIFTRCPLPTFCPRMSTHFAAAARRIESHPDTPSNWSLLTISFDPHHDTPSVLREYASRYDVDPDRWTFATGAQIEIDALTEQFGLTYGRIGEFFDHNLRTVVVDAAGIIRRIFVGNEWTPEELADEIVAATLLAP
jgi:protein SCO1